jgi:hypothetical protein
MVQSHLVLSPNQVRNDLSNKEITERINLSVNNKHRIHGEATSSTLVEDLASHKQGKRK